MLLEGREKKTIIRGENGTLCRVPPWPPYKKPAAARRGPRLGTAPAPPAGRQAWVNPNRAAAVATNGRSPCEWLFGFRVNGHGW